MKASIFLATPCYAGNVDVRYMESMITLMSTLQKFEMEGRFFNIPFDSLVPRARNTCANRFVNSECTHLMFIDADIGFDPMSVVKMVLEDVDIVCGAYPKKVIDFDEIKKNVSKCESLQELVEVSTRYAMNLKTGTLVGKTGLIEAIDAPTGFMLIKRKVIEDMIQSYPESQYENDIRAYKTENQNDMYYDLFQSKVFNKRYLSEDYGFCRLWQNIGGKIYIDLTVKLNHIGQFVYFGNPLKWLKFQQA